MPTISIIAIKGDHISNLNGITGAFKYVEGPTPKVFDSYDSTIQYLYSNYRSYADKGSALWGIWYDGHFTVICDLEMVDVTNEDTLEELSKKLNTEIFTFIIQTNSGTVGLAKYHHTKQRSFYRSGGQILENYGTPLPEEADLWLDSEYDHDISKFTEKFGIDLEGRSTNVKYLVKELVYNEQLKKELEMFAQPKKSLGRPWWRFW